MPKKKPAAPRARKKAPPPPAPTDAELTAALGPTRPYWDQLLARAHAANPKVTGGWKHYAGSGWTYVLRDPRRNLVYLKLGDGRFTANFAIGDAALAALPDAGVPSDLVQAIASAPRYPEGRPARLEVASSSTAKTAGQLLAVKMAH